MGTLEITALEGIGQAPQGKIPLTTAVHFFVPDVSFEPSNTVGSIAGVPPKPQPSLADRSFIRTVEPAKQFGMTQFRTRTQPVRALLVLVLDSSRWGIEYEYRCAEYEHEQEQAFSLRVNYSRHHNRGMSALTSGTLDVTEHAR